ncbi:MAG: DNA repair protein RecN [Alphaproteobacteria bacterium]|nr:DNA repair protein RecN [Alphaproteobacteria bacterium]
MLVHLSISNIVIIDALSLDLSAGFSAFTGETGAGKSILLDAIALATGNRGDTGLIRKGCEEASVTAVFQLSADHTIFELLAQQNLMDPDAPSEIRLRRILSHKRSKAFVNDIPVGTNILKKIGDSILDIHGQFDTLFDVASHRSILDQQIVDPDFILHKEQTKQFYHQWKQAEENVLRLKKQAMDNAQKAIVDRTIQEDLTPLDIQIDEEITLLKEREDITQLASLAQSVEKAQQLLCQPAFMKEFYAILSTLEKGQSPSIMGLIESLKAVEGNLLDIDAYTKSLLADTGHAASRLNHIDERLHTLRKMAKKYATSTDALPDLLKQAQENLCSNIDAEIMHEENQAKQYQIQYLEVAQQLTQHRKKAAAVLEQAVESQLAALYLPHARFRVNVVEKGSAHYHELGIDDIEFLIATNKGHDFAPLSKVASGGEASRIMLAIKSVMSKALNLSTIIFDEVETGVGGAIATAIGKHLFELSKATQVLSISHTPQVVAHAHHHYKVYKQHHMHETTSHIQYLDEAERLQETARMLAGEHITESSILAAQDLYQAGRLG